MRLLLADLLRTDRWAMAGFAVFAMVMFAASVSLGSTTQAFGISMAVAASFWSKLRYVPRSVWYLPVTKRDVWRARWLAMTVGVTLLMATAKLAAFAVVPQVRSSMPFTSLVLSSLYDFATAGFACSLVILATWPQGGPWHRLSACLKGLGEVTVPFVPPLAMFGCQMAPHLLPTRWTEQSPRSAAVLIAGLGLAAAAYFHSPAPATPANRVVQRPREAAPAPRVSGGPSGLQRLLVHEAVWTLMVGSALAIVSVLIVFVLAGFARTPGGFVAFARSILLELDGATATEPGNGFDGVIMLIIVAVFAASLVARFTAMLRHLRALPLTAARLNVLLIAWPALVWLIAWAVRLPLHFVVVGEAARVYHAGALVALVGASTIVQAITLRLPTVMRLVTLAPLPVLVVILLLGGVPPGATLAAAGAGAIAVAAVINHQALARKSTYTPVSMTVGIAVAPR